MQFEISAGRGLYVLANYTLAMNETDFCSSKHGSGGGGGETRISLGYLKHCSGLLSELCAQSMQQKSGAGQDHTAEGNHKEYSANEKSDKNDSLYGHSCMREEVYTRSFYVTMRATLKWVGKRGP